MYSLICRVLRELSLPETLEALERPIGIPPSILKKVEEVRTERGPGAIERMLDDTQRLSRRVRKILEEVSNFTPFREPKH
jgi:programmed cell death 6-interacting protein